MEREDINVPTIDDLKQKNISNKIRQDFYDNKMKIEYENKLNKKTDKIKLTNITLKETPETDEALYLFKEKNKIYSLFFYIPALITMIFLIILLSSYSIDIAYFTLYSLILFFIGLSIYQKLILPYKRLLAIAKTNDNERHKARIFYNEIKRLREEEK